MTSTEELLQANRRLSTSLVRIEEKVSGKTGLSVSEIVDLLSTLQVAMQLLRSIPLAERRRKPYTEPLAALAELLRRIQGVQPEMQTALLAERSRLHDEGAPLNAALAWTAAQKLWR